MVQNACPGSGGGHTKGREVRRLQVSRRRLWLCLTALVLLLLAAAVWWWTRSPRRSQPDHSTLVRSGQAGPAGAHHPAREGMPMTVVKVVELVGESEHSWDEAVREAVASAAKTLDHITGAEVVNITAKVDGGRITSYKANVKVAFVVDDSRRGG